MNFFQFNLKYKKEYRIIKKTFGNNTIRYDVEYRVKCSNILIPSTRWALDDWFVDLEAAKEEIENLKKLELSETVISKEVVK